MFKLLQNVTNDVPGALKWTEQMLNTNFQEAAGRNPFRQRISRKIYADFPYHAKIYLETS